MMDVVFNNISGIELIGYSAMMVVAFFGAIVWHKHNKNQ